MGKKQHDPDKERVFVRPITGAYSLTENSSGCGRCRG